MTSYNFYFNASGQLKFANGSSNAMAGIYDSIYSSSTSSSESSSFSNTFKQAALESAGMIVNEDGTITDMKTQMKNNALSKSGKLTADAKNDILKNNVNYQKVAAAKQRLYEIMTRKPRTIIMDDDDLEDYILDMDFSNFSSLATKQAAYNANGGSRRFQ